MKIKTTCSKTFNARLAAYSAAATAALLAAPAADATIQNITGLDVSLSFAPNENAHISFTAGPFHGYLFNHYSLISHSTVAQRRNVLDMSADVAVVSGFNLVSRLNFGDAIAGRSFQHGRYQVAGFSSIRYTSGGQSQARYGPFIPPHQSGYFAFKTGSYYGWLKLKVDFNSDGQPDGVSLIDNGDGIFGAYDKASDISADNFKIGSVAPVPEPSVAAIGGLGLLALGAAGVREMRRRRKAQEKI